MKKFILLLLILPLTLMARPQKIYTQKPMYSLWGSVYWQGSSLADGDCAWTKSLATANVFYAHDADDDCDDVARTKYGKYNITDVTCTDGSGSGCDGAYPIIKFSFVPKGHFQCDFLGWFYVSDASAEVSLRATDGTTDSEIMLFGQASGTSTGAGYAQGNWYYDKNQYDVTYQLKASAQVNTEQWVTFVRQSQNEDFKINCYTIPDSESYNLIITK